MKLEETCCHSNFSEKPSAITGVKNLQSSCNNNDNDDNAQRKRNQQILGNIGNGDERKIKKGYLRRTRKLLKKKLYCRNLIKGINTWAVPFIRYSGLFLKLAIEEFKQMDQRIRKLMIMHKALHPRDDIHRLYMSRKEGGRELASIQDSIYALIQ